MRDPRSGPEPHEVAAAAVLALPFAMHVLVLAIIASPSEANRQAADPILLVLPRQASPWIVSMLAAGAAAAWWSIARPAGAIIRSAARDALVGGAIVVLATLVLRAAVGPVLPAFVPPEESAAPGYLLSMSAGLLEEVVCRLGLLPVLFFGLRDRISGPSRAVASVAVTGLFFALWHAFGEDAWSASHFATRLLLPGCAMSAAWLVSPPATVVGHCVAHLLIPFLFASAG